MEVLSEVFKTYAQNITENAKALAGELTSRGIKLVTGGTDNHMILINLLPFGLKSSIFNSSPCGLWCVFFDSTCRQLKRCNLGERIQYMAREGIHRRFSIVKRHE
jgi:hypothetical protein